MKTVVIAFLARAGSGKTTAAQYLIENHGAVRVSFAAPLKVMAGELFDLNASQLYGRTKEVPDDRQIDSKTPRELMQMLGNCARENIGESVWVDAALNTIKKNPGKLVVIDDCRYPNEAEAIAALPDGYVVKLVSPDRASAADPNHPSEAGVDLVPEEHLFRTIENRQSEGLETFYQNIQEALIDALGVFPGRLCD